MGIHASAVRQNVAQGESDYYLVRGSSSSDSLPPPPVDLSYPRCLCGDKFVVNHLLLWQNVMLWDNMQVPYSSVIRFLFLPRLKVLYKLETRRFFLWDSEWPTLGSCLTGSHLFLMFPLSFTCFLSWASMLVRPWAFLVLFEPPESDFGCRCHDSLLLNSPIHLLPRNVSGKILETTPPPTPTFQFILKSWACSPAGFS